MSTYVVSSFGADTEVPSDGCSASVVDVFHYYNSPELVNNVNCAEHTDPGMRMMLLAMGLFLGGGANTVPLQGSCPSLREPTCPDCSSLTQKQRVRGASWCEWFTVLRSTLFV